MTFPFHPGEPLVSPLPPSSTRYTETSDSDLVVEGIYSVEESVSSLAVDLGKPIPDSEINPDSIIVGKIENIPDVIGLRSELSHDSELSRVKEALCRAAVKLNKTESLVNRPLYVATERMYRSTVKKELEGLRRVLSNIKHGLLWDNTSVLTLQMEPYADLTRTLLRRQHEASVVFRIAGKPVPEIPAWHSRLLNIETHWFTVTDWEILAIVYRMEVEDFLSRLDIMFDFRMKQPRNLLNNSTDPLREAKNIMNQAIGHTSQYIVTEVELAIPNQAEIHPSFTRRFSTSRYGMLPQQCFPLSTSSPISTQQGKVENISIPPSAPCWGVSPRDETPPVPLNSTPPGQKYWYSSLETLSHQPPPPPPSSQCPELPKQTTRTFDSGPSDDNSSNNDQDYIRKRLGIPLSSVSRVSSPSNICLVSQSPYSPDISLGDIPSVHVYPGPQASITNDLIPNIPDPVCLEATDNKSVVHGDIIRIHKFFTSMIPKEPCSNDQGGSSEGSACSGIDNRAVDAGTPLFTTYSRILQNTVACKSCETLPLDSHLLCSNAAQVVSVILPKEAASSTSGLITEAPAHFNRAR
ncbi:hypothetical protein C8J56DRAFT_1040694 [Mycena floridula]|nr:hypothetical protein C8J56DRAFT_1040694 [Mycena floridula]